MSADTYRGAVVWLPAEDFDLPVALDGVRSREWAADAFGGSRGFGYPQPELQDHLDWQAGQLQKLSDGAASSGDDIGGHVDEVLREVADLVPDLTWETPFTADVATAHALLCITAFALEVEMGTVSKHHDGWYEVKPAGAVVAFGAVSSGRDGDRATMTAIEAVLALPAFVPILRLGGALPPSQWVLADAQRTGAG